MEGVAAGWSRRELGLWLVGPYREATTPGPTHPGNPSSGEVDSASISDVLRETRWAVFAALEDAMHGDAKFVQLLARHRVITKDPLRGWIALDVAGTRLRSRVLSLFAIDQLIRPSDYLHTLLACPRCEGIVFDEPARREGHGCSRTLTTIPVASTGTRPAAPVRRNSDFVPRVTPSPFHAPTEPALAAVSDKPVRPPSQTKVPKP